MAYSDKVLKERKEIFNLLSSWFNTLKHMKRKIQILRKKCLFQSPYNFTVGKVTFDFNLGACFSSLVWENWEFSFNNSLLKFLNSFPIYLTHIQCSLKFWIPFSNYDDGRFLRCGFIFVLDTKRFNISNQNIKIIKIFLSSLLECMENIMNFCLFFWTYKIDYCKPWCEKTYSAMVKPFQN